MERDVLTESSRLLNEGRKETAAEVLQKYLANHPNDSDVLKALARVRLLQWKPIEAAKLFKRAEKLHKQSPTVYPEQLDIFSHENEDAPTSDDEVDLILDTDQQIRSRRVYVRFNEFEANTSSDRIDERDGQDALKYEGFPIQPVDQQKVAPKDQSPLDFGEDVEGDETPSTSKFNPGGGTFERLATSSRGTIRWETNDLFEFDDEHDAELPVSYREDVFPGDVTVDAGGGEELFETPESDEFDVLETLDLLPETDTDIEDSWEDLSLDADDYEPMPCREDFEAEVRDSGSLTRYDRALQIAMDVALPYDWKQADIYWLAEVFERYGWSQTKASIKRELANGMSFEEFRLAVACRGVWEMHPEFSIYDANRGICINPFSVNVHNTSDRFLTLSWPGALRLVRAFPGCVDVSEIERFLENTYDHWYGDPRLWRIFNSFRAYVDYRLGRSASSLKDWPDWTFEAAEKDDINDWSQQQGGTGLTSPRFSFLAQEGLLPELFVDRIRDRVIVDPKSEFLKKEALKCVETASNGDFTLEKRENSQNKRD